MPRRSQSDEPRRKNYLHCAGIVASKKRPGIAFEATPCPRKKKENYYFQGLRPHEDRAIYTTGTTRETKKKKRKKKKERSVTPCRKLELLEEKSKKKAYISS